MENGDIATTGEAYPNVQAAPEFAGQIASYVRSAHRRPDLHLMVDVGAGTTDITTFNIHQDFETLENVFPIFQPNIVNLGTHFLTANRVYQTPVSTVPHATQGILPAAQFSEAATA